MQPNNTTAARERNFPRIASCKRAMLTIHVQLNGFLCSQMPDLAVWYRATKKAPAVDFAQRECSKTWARRCIAKVSCSDRRALTRHPSTLCHHVPPPTRRMALHAQAKHLGILPRRHGPLTHPQRHRTQQTAMRSVRVKIHPHALRPDSRRVPKLLLQIHVLSRRSGCDVQAGARPRSCTWDDGEGQRAKNSVAVFESAAEVIEGG
jgi:hypothetical protein